MSKEEKNLEILTPPAWAQVPEEVVKKKKNEVKLTKEEEDILKQFRSGKLNKPLEVVEKEDLGNMAYLEGKIENLSQNVLKLTLEVVNKSKQRDTLVEQLNDLKTTHTTFITQFEAKYGLFGKKWEIEPSTRKIKIKEL